MMKSTKEIVFEYIQQATYTNADNAEGIETRTIAEALNMQRSNVSTLLNQLVSEKKLEKVQTRPVLYKIPKQQEKANENFSFSELVGYDGSLRNAIQLVKAAMLYPQHKLNVLIVAKSGCGSTYFSSLLYRFAKESGVLKEDAPFVKMNCRHYAKNISVVDDELFGSKENPNSFFEQARGGILFIDSFDLLNAKQQSRVFTFLENGIIYSDEGFGCDYSDVYLLLSCSPQNMATVSHKIPVTVELPELKNRPLLERFELIHRFFSNEAINSNHAIEVSTEAIQALMLSEFSYNIRELKHEIISACASAYVRVIDDEHKNIYVCINDFSTKIRRTLLRSKDVSEELSALLENQKYLFYDNNLEDYELNSDKNLYRRIQNKYQELSNHGVEHTKIEMVIDHHIKNLLKAFNHNYDEDESYNFEQLSKVVDKRIIELVSEFVANYQVSNGKQLRTNVFYALCLHINSLLSMTHTHQKVSNDQIVKVIQNYAKEYASASVLAEKLKQVLGLELDISETIIITLFLIEPEENEDENTPVLLYIMHGNSTAASLAEVTNTLTHCDNAYSYDLRLDVDTQQAMEEIKALIQKVDRGAGVFVIYDMGSIKTMVDTIAEEIDVKIRYLNIPLTLIGIDVARKCSMEKDIDTVYHHAFLDLRNLEVRPVANPKNMAIITLCHTGEGGAIQLKNYIDHHSKLGMTTIPLTISDRDYLIKEVINIRKTYTIHAFAGTYDPKLLGIPFISISSIFACKKENIDRVLQFEPQTGQDLNYQEIYQRFEGEFKYTSISKLKMVLPSIVDELALMYSLDKDQGLGIFMHLACFVERALAGQRMKRNPEAEKILTVLEEDCKAIAKVLKRLEKAFKILVDDNELSIIVMLLKKI